MQRMRHVAHAATRIWFTPLAPRWARGPAQATIMKNATTSVMMQPTMTSMRAKAEGSATVAQGDSQEEAPTCKE